MNQYKQLLAERVSEQLGASINIEALNARLHGFSPELLLSNVVIASTNNEQPPQAAISIKEIRLAMSWLGLFSQQNWLASASVTIVGAKFSLQKQQDASWQLVGLKPSDTKQQPTWLLNARRYQLLETDITWLSPQLNVTTHVNAAINNANNRHRLNALVSVLAPTNTATNLRLSADITGDVFGSNFNGASFIEANNLQLGEWLTLFEANSKLPISLMHADLTGKVWTSWQNAQPTRLEGDMQLKQLQLTQQDSRNIKLKQLSSRFSAQLAQQQWLIELNDLKLHTSNNTSLEGAVRLSATNNKPQQLSLVIKQANLQDISPLAQFLTPDNTQTWLKQAQLQGTLKNVSALINLSDDKHFAINGAFTDFSISPTAAMPVGISKLSGDITGTQQRGLLSFHTQNSQLNLPTLFQVSPSIERVNATLGWLQTKDSWQLNSKRIELKLQGLQTTSRLNLTLPKDSSSPFLDLQMAMTSDDISKLHYNLPDKVTHPVTVKWLNESLVSGQITQGGLLYYGKLNGYPFNDNSGVFEANLKVQQGTLQYAPDWPAITDIDADVFFFKNTLQVDGHYGHSDGLLINQAVVINPELGKSTTLSINGKVSGAIAQVLHFLRQSPLHERVTALSEAITPQGDTTVDFTIGLPLTEKPTPPKVDGTAQLNHAKLTVKALDLLVSDINGQLKFNEHGLFSDTLHAVALNNPITAIIKDTDDKTQIDVTGHASVKELQQQFPLPWWSIATGSTDYNLSLNLPRTATESAELQVNSQLKGIALELPDGLAKSAAQTQALAVTFVLNGKDELPIRLNYAGQLKAAVSLAISSQSLRSGHVLIGEGEVTDSGEAGFTLDISHKKLSLDNWLGILLSAKASSDEQASTINTLSIHSEQASWHKTQLGAFALTLNRQGSHWLGSINSRIAAGMIKIPLSCTDAQGIQLRLDSLDIGLLTQLGDSAGGVNTGKYSPHTIKPEAVPLLTLSSQHTTWQNLPLGRLQLSTQRINNGIKLRNLELTGEDSSLSLTGAWQAGTQLQGRLQSSNAGQLLRRFGISKDLKDGKGAVDFMLHWQAPPQAISLSTMQGYGDLQLTNGRILNVDPGLGRILGVLAMAQWTKRLQLDFSDLYMQGMIFNSISGHVDIANGIASSNNLIIDAIPAKITLTGTSDLASQTLDQLINVAPKSADAVPIAGTLLGKISSVFSQSLTGKNHDELFFGSQYHALGTWKNPQIIPLHENDGLIQKTWKGLTRFPWIRNPLSHNKLKATESH